MTRSAPRATAQELGRDRAHNHSVKGLVRFSHVSTTASCGVPSSDGMMMPSHMSLVVSNEISQRSGCAFGSSTPNPASLNTVKISWGNSCCSQALKTCSNLGRANRNYAASLREPPFTFLIRTFRRVRNEHEPHATEVRVSDARRKKPHLQVVENAHTYCTERSQ